MSASPAGGPPSGPAATTPNAGAAGTMQRKRPQSNPFMAKKKPIKKIPGAVAAAGANGAGKMASKPGGPTTSKAVAEEVDPDDDPSKYTAYPLVASKKALLQGFRYHAMRLASQHEANPYDETQFTRPLRLHRRFARDQKIVDATENGADDKEREKEEIRKAERQAQKDANQAQIAPTDKAAQKKKVPHFKKKVEDVFYPQDTPEAQKRAKLRYEEGRPWHLEDFDSKNTWVGSYDEPMSEIHAMLALDGNGNFRMVPLEKWYRFIPTNRFKTMNLDEAEEHMAKKFKDSRWYAEKNLSEEQKQRFEADRQRLMQRGRVGMRGERGGRVKEDEDDEKPEEVHDADEIDYNAEDEFQDDDEGGLFLGDEEDVKESERKMRQEMLGANIFAGTGVKEEKDWDAEEEAEKKKSAAERKRQRKLRRTLVKNERKFEYESESDHPYSESSDSSSEDELTKDEVKKEDDKASVTLNGDKLASGASSMGNNTPAGRSEKHGDLRSSHLAGSALKRPGSPNLSEASGSESSRKRIKKEGGANGQISRPMSPSIASAKGLLSPSTIPRRRGAGSGSDTEASGTERATARSKIRLNATSRDASPANSAPGSRAASPPRSAGPATPTATDAAIAGLPSAEEVKAAIPAQGISIQDLIRRFRARIPRTANAAFIGLVKKVGKNPPGDKGIIVPK